MENMFSNLNLLKLIIKWRIHLIVILALSVALAALFSSPWFIKPKFKSMAVLYPSNLIPYSSETPTELMLQIFRSDDIRDSVIEKFNLASHYNIDKNEKFYYTKVIKAFEGNVSIHKTEYESVVIEILDTDPQTACNMVKEIIAMFNKKARKMQREKSQEVLKISETQLAIKEAQIDSLQNKLEALRVNYGILDYKVQTKESMKAFYKAGGGNQNINSTIENLKAKGGDYLLLIEKFDASTTLYNKLKEDYETALRDVTKELTYTNYVSSPVPADKKTYPIRWLIIAVTSVMTMAFTIVIILILENLRLKKKTTETSENTEKRRDNY